MWKDDDARTGHIERALGRSDISRATHLRGEKFRANTSPGDSVFTQYESGTLHRSQAAGLRFNHSTMRYNGVLKWDRMEASQGKPGNTEAAIGRRYPPSSHGGGSRREAPLSRCTWKLVMLHVRAGAMEGFPCCDGGLGFCWVSSHSILVKCDM